MKRKPLNKSRFTYLKQNTPLNVVPEKKLKKADLAGLIENRGKSRFRTKKLRERVETLIRSDLVFKNKTNATNKRIVPSPLTLLRTTFVPQARNTLKAKYPFHLNMNAKRTVHLLVVRTSVDRDRDRDASHGHGHGHVVKQVGSTSAASVGVGAKQHQHQQASCSGSSTTTCEAISKAISEAQSNCVPSKAHEQKKMVEKDEIGTKYIVKRTVLGSTRIFSNTRFKVHSQDLKQLIEGRGRKVSPYKARLLERKKLSLIYGNLGWRELRKCVLQSKHKKGVASPKSGNKKTRPQTSSLPENLITLLESRLDVVLYRCRFFPSFSSCKQAINHGKIFVNHRQVRIAGHLLKAGDLIQVNPQSKQSLLVVRTSVDRDRDRAKGHGHASKSEHKQFQRNATKTFVACPGSARKEQEHVVSKKANYLLALENEKQKTLLYFQNKIKSRPFSPFLPSALLTRFDPLHHFPWNTKQKPNQLNNTTTCEASREAISKAIALHNKQDYGSCFLRPSCLGTAVPASDPLSTSFNRTTSCKARSPLSLNLENRANSLFRDLKERKRILRTLSSRSNERLDGDGKSFDHVTRTTGRLIKPLRNRDNPFLFLRPQSKSGVMRSNPLARTNNKGIAGSGIGKEHNTLSTVGTARAATGLRGLMLCQGKKHESKSEHVLRATTTCEASREAISKAIKQSTGLKKLFPPFYRAVKPLNLEVSYQTLTAIFLFPPQKIYFPAHIDLEMIGKSI